MHSHHYTYTGIWLIIVSIIIIRLAAATSHLISLICKLQIALAEEYHKPIMTVRLEAVGEMDPGLKLIIQRRQVRRLAIQHPYITIDVIYFV